jgi:hypothetical protein
MKFLTIIGTIFIPLTFLAGVYGMNFKFMPELEWRWGYLSLWIMLAIGVTMVIFFKERGGCDENKTPDCGCPACPVRYRADPNTRNHFGCFLASACPR